jgi:hypothetical protein
MFIDPELNNLFNCSRDTTNYDDKHNNSEETCKPITVLF